MTTRTLPGVPRDLAEHLESAPSTTPPAGVPRDLAAHEGRESYAASLPGLPEHVGYVAERASGTGSPAEDDGRDSADDNSTHQ